MLASDPLYITAEDYLAAEEVSPIRHEYRDGEVFAMTGGSRNHNFIVGSLLIALRLQLRGSGCSTFSENVKTRIETRNTFYYPDLLVTCDDRDRPNCEQYVNHPCLIIEVLSPSTANFDRTEKFADYRTIPTLIEYLLVSTDRQQVEHFRKDARGKWCLVPPSDPIRLTSIHCTIPLADIYENIEL
ncbi:MAG: Uma2 family endonuclease [Coleofasciculaceae cyanobacterium RL_1_1]|nr:Uma2 family endonuclease [Coleofasciculaceae cyanobacterium RL_1_1]